jgi:C-terminal processing protease CtpA/Prc
MLATIKTDIEHHYYDPTFRGMNLDERFKAANQKIEEATSNGQIFGIIAQVLIELDDSHTFFIPPQRASRVDYGWQMEMIGDRCFVVAVEPGSDAASKGVKPGDELLSVGGYPPVRAQLWKLKYLIYTLRPVPSVRVVLRNQSGEHQVDLACKIKQGKQTIDLTGGNGGNDIWELIRDAENSEKVNAHRYVELGDDLFIWKMPAFDLSPDEVDKMIAKAEKRKALIIDMRGNPGGAVVSLQRLISSVIDHDVTIGDLKRRKNPGPLIAKGRSRAFSGKLILLVDSESGSCAELFARVIQLEKRGVVLGDQTAGKVMLSVVYDHKTGTDTIIPYDVSVTDADVIMTDGKSLEKVGVTPDQMILTTVADLYANRDPVLSTAAAIAGVKIDPARAGAMFPVEWKK